MPPSTIDPEHVKADSERIILAAGGRICDWLPHLDITTVRDRDAIVGRALVLNALLQIAFEAPTHLVKKWIHEHGVAHHLSPNEKALVEKENASLSKQESTDVYWYIEALWTLLWVGGLIENCAFDKPIENHMASLCPSLQHDENGSKFADTFQVKPFDDLYRMLDLYYRLHWWTRDAQLNSHETGDVSLDIIMERRKALEWVMDDTSDWDDIDLST